MIIPGMEFDNTFEQEKGFRCFYTVCIRPGYGKGRKNVKAILEALKNGGKGD